MAKVSNETRLVISLFKERAKKRQEQVRMHRHPDSERWADGIIKGLEEAENILAGIANELEHPDRT